MAEDSPTGEDVPTDEGLRIVLVAAVAENGVIGRAGAMPWHLPADLAHFEETTTGHPVVMGRLTYESIAADIGGPFPNRTSVVLTTTGVDTEDERVVEVGGVDAALAAAGADARERGVRTVYVGGGETVYEQFLSHADRLVLTELDESHEGDTRFPEWDREAFVEVEREEREGFAFVTYERR
ncbi:dihydrofolate reductase [Halomarina oriensis]|uniref:dihydrofolate reductase n=1 Tax=Halomarina oriensis TaxID=671145 RepID=A0A6B0GUZ4_9EURY|nr:dihydrofolate reductase [Halomarina oriensis]